MIFVRDPYRYLIEKYHKYVIPELKMVRRLDHSDVTVDDIYEYIDYIDDKYLDRKEMENKFDLLRP